MGKTILVIGDSHAGGEGEKNLDRFDWLGNMILDMKPDIIVDMGDWADMPSLSSYDFGKKSYEGRRYKRDVSVAKEARTRLMVPTGEFNRTQGVSHRTRYKPRKVSLGGNHEEARINRAIESNPMLDGIISHWDLGYKELGWEYVPFGQEINIEGLYFSHYFVGGVRDKPVDGMYPTATLLKRYHTSRVMGHTHYFQVRHELCGEGKIWAFIAGCYFDYIPSWTKQSHNFYDRGILLLHGVENGNVESFSWVGIDTIKRRYG